MESAAIIEVRGLTRRFGRRTVLDDLEFDIDRGEIFGLLGPNGAGKSTFISVLTTLLRPTAGDIFVNSVSVSRHSGRIKKSIGYVPQDIALYPALSGLDNLNFWAGIYGISGSTRKERVREVLSIVKLEDRAADRVSEYSGGMKRRLNIAVALMHRPEILIMDEPTVGVDVQSRKLIMEAVRNLKQEGRTVIFTSHYIDEMETLCDRLAVLDKGRILAIGAADELKKQYGTQSTEEILLKLIDAVD